MIEEFGTRRISDYGFEDYERHNITLNFSTIKKLQMNGNLRISRIAAEMIECIEKNSPLLLLDEVGLTKSLGMKMSLHPDMITLFTETGRVSVKWTASTKGHASGIRWALMVPPNHERKRKAVADWLAKHFIEPKK